jgi:putative aldouronate transport system permease protein
MVQKTTPGERFFDILIYVVMGLLSISCILPIIHIFAISLSDKSASAAGWVGLWPVNYTTVAYEYILTKPDFVKAFAVSLQRLALGIPLNIAMVLITAYPLSHSSQDFKGRTIYMWYFVFTMLFGGGLIPTYLNISRLKLLDSIWALILPGLLPVWNMILMVNFFRGLPKALEESAFIDGAGHIRVLINIYMPLSTPALATIGLFTAVGHWNAWFDGLIYMNSPAKYPLQTYIRTVVMAATADMIQMFEGENWRIMSKLSDKGVRCAQIFLGALPILCVYPFLQKYFMTGIVLGSVKE